MILRKSSFFACLIAGIAVFCCYVPLQAQTGDSTSAGPQAVLAADSELPDAPQPQNPPATPASSTPATSGSGQQPAPDASSATSPNGQDTSKTPDAAQQKSQRDVAEEQLKRQEHQRVLGIVPNFNTSYVYGAASLTSGQKFRLALRSQLDPVSFGVAGFVALIGQAEGADYAYGGGIGGYAKRYGSNYTTNFDGQMLGNALLPSILHQDPRYFRLGRGSVKRRIWYALGTNIIARHDVTGHWEPNYSNILGNFAAGGISNLYIPENERGFSSTITGGLVVIAECGAGSMFQEFWPDICRRFLHKDPTHGQDAINKMKPDPTGGGNPFSNHRQQ